MSRSLAHLSVAALYSQPQLVLQFLKVGKFPLYIDQLFFQSLPHRRARLQAASAQTQETSDLAEFEPQALYTTYEIQCLEVVFTVLAEAALRPWGPPPQCIPLVEANRIYAEPNLWC